MNRQHFVRRRTAAWQRFEQLVRRRELGTRGKLSSAEIGEYSRLFRELCNDLAVLRSRDWGQELVSYLNHLVSRGHSGLYAAPPGNFRAVGRFLVSGFPRLLRANWGYFLTASALFFLPLAAGWVLVQQNPSLASRVVPAEQLELIESMYDRDPAESLSQGDDRLYMSGYYVANNVGIALRAFGVGVLFGVPTVYVLLYNGIALGAVSGFVIGRGHGDSFLSFVVSHGSFELTAIAVAGAAGLMLGDALVRPGARTRFESLKVRGFDAVKIAAGAAAMLVVAAGIEAFWSPSGAPVTAKYVVGGLLWITVFLYLGVAGRGAGPASDSQPPASGRRKPAGDSPTRKSPFHD
ncbi:MAG: stage II sporulation protein M [Planctomycetales bacterium]